MQHEHLPVSAHLETHSVWNTAGAQEIFVEGGNEGNEEGKREGQRQRGRQNRKEGRSEGVRERERTEKGNNFLTAV